MTIKQLTACLIISLISTTVHSAGYNDADQASVTSSPNEFYIVTAHIDGNTSVTGNGDHPPEAIPEAKLPAGGGLSIKQEENGKWRMSAFKFIPSQIIATANQKITLHFVDVQGPSHEIQIDGVEDTVQLKRGEVQTVTLQPSQPGVINFRSIHRQPSMSGQVIVLPE